MKKKNKSEYKITAIGLALILLCGCGSNGVKESLSIWSDAKQEDLSVEQPDTRSEEPAGQQSDIHQAVSGEEEICFTDDLGRQISLKPPGKVAALIGSFADIWLLAGGELAAAANDSWDSLSLPLGEQVVNLGSITEPDVESLIMAQPDLVLASVNTDADLALEEILLQAGIPVAYFSVSDFEEYLHMLDICTMLTGRRDLYEENGLKVQEEIRKVKERVDGSSPRVLFLRASASSVKAKGSEGNVCGEMLADLGCINIADSEDSLLEDLSMEAIIAADPDYIFITTQGSNQEAAMENARQLLIQNPAWNTLTAVKEGRYYVLDKRLYNLKPNARWGEAYRGLADILYECILYE